MEQQLKQGNDLLTKEKRDDLIHQYAPLIKHIAQRIAVRLPPNIDLDDLINSGIIGLMDAISKYDPSKNIKFRTYAEFRIRGAIVDELRSMDWMPRSARQKANMLERAYSQVEQRKGRAATDQEVAQMMGVEVVKIGQLLHEVSGVTLINPEDLEKSVPGLKINAMYEMLISGQQLEPAEVFNARQLRDTLAQAIDELPQRERTVISLYYYEDLTMKEIGEVMGITESRVSQIHTKAVLRLKGKLKSVLGIEEISS
jgi:RNA polymerase sigma factor for flagellar operon FliA